MPFTEIVLPKLKADTETKAEFVAQWPTSVKILASQPTIIREFLGWVIKENHVNTEKENKPILIIGAIDWTSVKKPNSNRICRMDARGRIQFVPCLGGFRVFPPTN